MRQVSNCLNAILVLLTLPLYLLAPLAALAGKAFDSLVLGWLPPGLAFIATETFLVIAVGLFLWYLIVNAMVMDRRRSSGMESCCLEIAFAIFDDDLSGYLLLAGVIAAVVVLKLVL